MILVADSGSTKTNWLVPGGTCIATKGFNPFFHTAASVQQELQQTPDLMTLADQITEVYFYGAGCSSEARNQIIHDGLQPLFSKASIVIDHDLKAAALATYDGRPCVSCILGTGSNSCFFNGRQIDNSVPALGYILGDEGSGSYFGKQLLTAFLYHELPSATNRILEEEYSLTKEKVFWSVYNEPNANVYLAGFSKVLSESPDKEYIHNLVYEGFISFFRHHVICYMQDQQVPVHFVGSLAFHFKDILEAVATHFNCELGKVDKQPVFSLLEWHTRSKNQAAY